VMRAELCGVLVFFWSGTAGLRCHYVATEENTSVHGGTDVEKRHFGCTLSSIFRMIRSAHCTAAAIIASVLGLPPGPPNRSSAVVR
jgi:hypothetical protein